MCNGDPKVQRLVQEWGGGWRASQGVFMLDLDLECHILRPPRVRHQIEQDHPPAVMRVTSMAYHHAFAPPPVCDMCDTCDDCASDLVNAFRVPTLTIEMEEKDSDVPHQGIWDEGERRFLIDEITEDEENQEDDEGNAIMCRYPIYFPTLGDPLPAIMGIDNIPHTLVIPNAVPTCTICHTNPKNMVLPCGHTFCDVCINETINSGNRTCPVCRREDACVRSTRLFL